MNFSEIRKDINRVDSAIRELFLLRMSLALEVAETKAQSDDKIYKPDREAEIIEKRSAGMEEELRLKYIVPAAEHDPREPRVSVQRDPASEPRKVPVPSRRARRCKPKTVFYQGVPGAYQELAARALFPELRAAERPDLGAGLPVGARRQGRCRRRSGREHDRRHGQRGL